VDPADYERVATELETTGSLSEATRWELARKAFSHTAAYDLAIASYLARQAEQPAFGLMGHSGQALRYGEDPHQAAFFCRTGKRPEEPSVAWAEVLGGKALSYNNLLDLESALAAVKEFDDCACVIVKHNNPCGVALGRTPAEAFDRAREVDPVSAFGGIVALNRPVDAEAARALTSIFLECVIAPGYDEEAREILSAKKNLRLLSDPLLGRPRSEWVRQGQEVRSLVGGLLVQDRDLGEVKESDLKVVTRRAPTPDELRAALLAWKVVKHVKSNAIVFGAKDRVLAIGAGQTSRVDAVKLAASK